MARNSKRDAFYKLFYNSNNNDYTIVDFLNDSSCDEIAEIDLNKNKFKQVYHTQGKYFFPLIDDSFSELFDFTCKHIVHPEDIDVFKDLMDPNHILEKLTKSRIPNLRYKQFRFKLQNGDYRWVEQCVVTGKESGLKEGVIRAYLFDIENRKNREKGQIVNEDNFISKDRDIITGLLAPEPFFKAAKKLINAKKEEKWCIVSIDIEKFKLYNDWFGRRAGDFLLARIGAIFSEIGHELGGVAGYFGRDNFSIVMPYDMQVIDNLFERIRGMIVSSCHSLGFVPAFGVYIINEDDDIIEAFDKSNIAVRKAKSDIRKRIYLFSPDMQSFMDNEVRILGDFMQALKNDELTFYLQPQCRISSKKIVGVESLARWVKPDGTIVSPVDFIPLLEKYGFIIDLDQYLWDKVCGWLRSCLDRGLKPVPVSLNISRADIFSINILDHFTKLVAKYKLPPSLIKLEITESAYTETITKIGELVANLREAGFMVLMDDFGSGYSSLNMLSNLNFDAIKLDATFLKFNQIENEKGIHILESVISMAKIIGLPIIVEGVETKNQCDFLKDLGCRYIQGFYFYRPMPYQDFEKIMVDENNVDYQGFILKANEQFKTREFLETIYSDSMLNNIIGSVAYYALHDNHIDIVRFNEQFYRSVNVPDFHDRLKNIERFVPEADHEKLYSLFEKAEDDKLNGASDIIRFSVPSGDFVSFYLHLYYLGLKDGEKLFYGSVQNATELNELKDQLSLISKYSNDTLIFIRYMNKEWSYLVATYGLSSAMGQNREDLQEELNSGHFYRDRLLVQENIKEISEKGFKMMQERKTFSLSVKIINDDEEIVPIMVHFSPASNKANNIQYVLEITTR